MLLVTTKRNGCISEKMSYDSHMRLALFSVFLAFASTMMVSAQVSSSSAPVVQDVLKLHRADVAEDVIVAFIENSPRARLDASELIDLHSQGVSTRILLALYNPGQTNSVTSEPVTSESAAPTFAETGAPEVLMPGPPLRTDYVAEAEPTYLLDGYYYPDYYPYSYYYPYYYYPYYRYPWYVSDNWWFGLSIGWGWGWGYGWYGYACYYPRYGCGWYGGYHGHYGDSYNRANAHYGETRDINSQRNEPRYPNTRNLSGGSASPTPGNASRPTYGSNGNVAAGASANGAGTRPTSRSTEAQANTRTRNEPGRTSGSVSGQSARPTSTWSRANQTPSRPAYAAGSSAARTSVWSTDTRSASRPSATRASSRPTSSSAGLNSSAPVRTDTTPRYAGSSAAATRSYRPAGGGYSATSAANRPSMTSSAFRSSSRPASSARSFGGGNSARGFSSSRSFSSPSGFSGGRSVGRPSGSFGGGNAGGGSRGGRR